MFGSASVSSVELVLYGHEECFYVSVFYLVNLHLVLGKCHPEFTETYSHILARPKLVITWFS
jgi:hypothetical protein